MANKDFVNDKFKGAFKWIHLSKPFAFNSMEGKSVPVEPNTAGAKYSISWTLSAEEGAAFEAKCKEHFEARKAEDKKIKSDFGAVHGLKKNEDSTWSVTASRKAMNAKGEMTGVPVINQYQDPMADLDLWDGSIGTALFSMYPAPNPSSGKWGISLNLLKVQITEAQRGGDDSDFEKIERPQPKDPFGLPAAEAAKTEETEYDEIPF